MDAPSEGTPWSPTTLITRLAPAEISARLLSLAKRGKLPGYGGGVEGALFTTEIHAAPFDRLLVAEATRDEERGETRLTLRLHTLRKTPWLFGIVTAISAGPGLWLTHSMLETYFAWYTLSIAWTAAWYLVLTVAPLPWLIPGMWRKSSHAASEHAREVTATIAGAIEGT